MAKTYIRTDEVLLKVEGVSLSFGDNLVLRDVNATINNIEGVDAVRGQVVCFLGPSGIGKTQLSRIIAGLQKPSKGTVTLKGGVPTQAGAVSMLPQFYPMFDYCTVAENLRIAGKMGGLNDKEINEKASGYIETFGLGEHLGKFPRDLSGGTKQRVAIARQLMCVSNYIVMDEPFSGLDPISKAKTMEAITLLAGSDTYMTIIVVTHAVTEGLTIADTVWMLGYEKDANNGNANVAGARLVHTVDLAELGFAWRPDLEHDPTFLQFAREIKDRFKTLK